MNQPTREEFEAFKQEVRQEVKQIREQVTEPINLRIERGLSVGEEQMLQTIMTMVGKHATDIASLKQSVESLESKMEKRLEAIAEVQKLILDRLPKPPES